jgi:uracil DNA glycosylase superfamily protein
MHECDKCAVYGLRFQRTYAPEDSIEGNRAARIWIIGLNPAVDPEWVDTRSIAELEAYFDSPRAVHSYFRDFAKVSRTLHERFGKAGGVAHTDLVKCSHKSWPPPGVKSREAQQIVENCRQFLIAQLNQFTPAMIICNGAEVSTAIKEIFVPPDPASDDLVTSYICEHRRGRTCIVLSGFIGRIDNYAKRRLGREIEARLVELGLLT